MGINVVIFIKARSQLIIDYDSCPNLLAQFLSYIWKSPIDFVMRWESYCIRRVDNITEKLCEALWRFQCNESNESTQTQVAWMLELNYDSIKARQPEYCHFVWLTDTRELPFSILCSWMILTHWPSKSHGNIYSGFEVAYYDAVVVVNELDCYL